MGKKKNKREYIENYLATVGKKREETNNVEKVEIKIWLLVQM